MKQPALKRYADPDKQIKKMNAFNKATYQTFIFYLNKISDKKIINYFSKADNKTEALRKLFK